MHAEVACTETLSRNPSTSTSGQADDDRGPSPQIPAGRRAGARMREMSPLTAHPANIPTACPAHRGHGRCGGDTGRRPRARPPREPAPRRGSGRGRCAQRLPCVPWPAGRAPAARRGGVQVVGSLKGSTRPVTPSSTSSGRPRRSSRSGGVPSAMLHRHQSERLLPRRQQRQLERAHDLRDVLAVAEEVNGGPPTSASRPAARAPSSIGAVVEADAPAGEGDAAQSAGGRRCPPRTWATARIAMSCAFHGVDLGDLPEQERSAVPDPRSGAQHATVDRARCGRCCCRRGSRPAGPVRR